MECVLLCALATSVGFQKEPGMVACNYCAEIRQNQALCYEKNLTAFECRHDNIDLARDKLYCIDIAVTKADGKIYINSRCLPPEDFPGDGWAFTDYFKNNTCAVQSDTKEQRQKNKKRRLCDCAACHPDWLPTTLTPPLSTTNKHKRRRPYRRRKKGTKGQSKIGANVLVVTVFAAVLGFL